MLTFSILSFVVVVAGLDASRRVSFERLLQTKQEELCGALEALDGSGLAFSRDEWRRKDGSLGLTRVLQGGNVVEKGGVSTTFARGVLSEQRASSMLKRGRMVRAGQAYSASALSIVLHARSPHVPTFRADVRLFSVEGESWFGGGADLTPAVLYEADAMDWHSHWRSVCERHPSPGLYARLKRACDEYFYLPLRGEHRGIGGLFFDDLEDLENPEAFVRDVVDNFYPSWAGIVARRRDIAYTDDEVHWQRLRRGRYVEFNLLDDRGVKFGLSPEAMERVFVSAPPLVAWDYGRPEPAPNSNQGQLLAVLRQPRDWVSPSSEKDASSS